MKKTRLISLLLTLVMILSISPFAFAADIADIDTETSFASEQFSELQPSEKPAYTPNPNGAALPPFMPAAFSDYAPITDVLGATGSENDYGYYAVAPGQIFQATLVCPTNANLDYDMYLVEVNTTTLAPIAVVNQSVLGTYINSGVGKTVDEKVGVVNNGSATRAFYIAVVAGVGGTAGQYTLNASISNTFDALEWDGNPVAAKSITTPSNTAVTVSNRTINTPNDDDWMTINIPSSIGFTGITFSLDSTSRADGYQVEVYAYDSNSGGMRRLGANTTITITNSGTHYIRVFSSGTVNESRNYTLTMTPVFPAPVAANISITSIINNDGASAPRVVYSNYFSDSLFRVTRGTITVNGRVTSSSGAGVPYTNVNLLWENQHWSNPSLKESRGSGSTDANGYYSIDITLSAPMAACSQYLPGAINFIHYFDIGIFAASVEGTSVSNAIIAYEFAYSSIA